MKLKQIVLAFSLFLMLIVVISINGCYKGDESSCQCENGGEPTKYEGDCYCDCPENYYGDKCQYKVGSDH